MKKITLLAVAALAISLASCKKDRTCTCTVTPVSQSSNGTSFPVSGTDTYVTKLTKVSKKGAACNSGEKTSTSVNGSNTYVSVDKWDCKLD